MRLGRAAARLLAALVLICGTGSAFADDVSLIRAQVNATRGAVIDLMAAPERRTPDRVAALVELIGQVSDRLAALRAPTEKQRLLAEVREAWVSYRASLESEFLPALLSGREAEARRVALRLHRDAASRVRQGLGLLQP